MNPLQSADNPLSKLLDERPWLLADGATGTNLFNMGLASGEAPELWNLDAPEKIRALHNGFIEAGCDIILTNSFGGNRYRLKLHGAQDRVGEINKRAAALARDCANAAGREMIVAASMGPTGEILAPVGALAHEDAVAAFVEQGRALMEGGADVLWAETISSNEEISAFAEAMAELNAPFCATLSFDTAGRTMMGLTSADYANLATQFLKAPIAFGANCGVGAADLLRSILGMREAAPEAALIAKGNAGIPKYVEGHIHYDGSPELMADYAIMAVDCGARIIGGCCGSTFEHMARMRAALEAHEKSAPPSLAEIEARLGGFSSPSDGLSGDAPAKRERRGGRRRG